jgi:hypothetical protein
MFDRRHMAGGNRAARHPHGGRAAPVEFTITLAILLTGGSVAALLGQVNGPLYLEEALNACSKPPKKGLSWHVEH